MRIIKPGFTIMFHAVQPCHGMLKRQVFLMLVCALFVCNTR
jgi:hypothetical protein